MKPIPFVVCLIAVLAPQPGRADDYALIWQPSKASDTSYSARIGVRMPLTLAPSLGLDGGLVAGEGGAVVDAPVAAWGSIKLQEQSAPAGTVTQTATGRLDAVSGSASLTLNYYKKHIATPTLNIERRSAYAVSYDGSGGSWGGLRASQSIRVTRVRSGSSVLAEASTTDSLEKVNWGLAVEQRLGQQLTVKATLRDETGGEGAVAKLRADYRFRW
ncbi:hypothetical protein ABID21_004416 [Pseudorhizobium tarimense]|uniref:Uncharacterized protein n=1 Tax=Pseudorhizobium tarimense TaxID=1079109 RepID=A0ABV2HCN0_9HYPH|nr:hypothetical protein [Pseudorhizobium tarimense]MCJ8521310.1 hypothetical protein [Pseudorhizobium tarimense]